MKTRNEMRKIRHRRVRKKVFGTAERPRLCVFRSHKHIYVQAIDDERGHTLAAASTLDPEIRGQLPEKPVERARVVGQLIGRRLLALGIRRAVFDRGGYKYTGRVRALAEGAREAGLEF